MQVFIASFVTERVLKLIGNTGRFNVTVLKGNKSAAGDFQGKKFGDL